MSLSRPWRYAVIASLLGMLSIFYWLGLTSFAGQVGDDAVYLITGKALALGDGYRLLNEPGMPYQIACPPLYPALLALVWRIAPNFPGNLLDFKLLNILTALAGLLLSYHLVVKAYGMSRLQGWTIAVLVAFSSAFIVFVDLTMSELLFVACLMGALLWIETHIDRADMPIPWLALCLGLFATLPSMVRSTGLVLPVAIACYLIIARRWKLFIATSVSLVLWQLPWQGWLWAVSWTRSAHSWGYMDAVGKDTGGFQFGQLFHNLVSNLWMAFIVHIPAQLAPRFQFGPVLTVAGGSGLGAGFLVGILLLLVCLAGYAVDLRSKLRVYHLFIPLYLGLVSLVPWDMGRYVEVLTPLLFYCLVQGTSWMWRNAFGLSREGNRWGGIGVRVLTIGMLLLCMSGGVRRVASLAWHRDFHDALLPAQMKIEQADLRALCAWSETNVPQDALWLSARPPLLYMLTGKRAIAYSDGPNPSAQHRAWFRQWPTYMVDTPGRPDDEFTTPGAFRKAHPENMKTVFLTPGHTFRVSRISGGGR